MCETRKEEIYEVKGEILVGDKKLPIEIVDYESRVIEILINDYGMNHEETNWLDFIEDKGWTISIYPYYIESSPEVVLIEHPDGSITPRPLMVEGMQRHTEHQLMSLRARDKFKIGEIADIERWRGTHKFLEGSKESIEQNNS